MTPDGPPCAGELRDCGTSKGHNYSVNVPLQEGVDDESYKLVFEPILDKVGPDPGRWRRP